MGVDVLVLRKRREMGWGFPVVHRHDDAVGIDDGGDDNQFFAALDRLLTQHAESDLATKAASMLEADKIFPPDMRAQILEFAGADTCV